MGSGFNSEPATEPGKQGTSLELSNSQDAKCQVWHNFAQAAKGQSASIWKQRDKQYPSDPSCCRPCAALAHTTSESDVVTVWWHETTSWQKKFGRFLRGLGQIQRTALLGNKTGRGRDQMMQHVNKGYSFISYSTKCEGLLCFSNLTPHFIGKMWMTSERFCSSVVHSRINFSTASSQALDEKLRFHTFWRPSQEKCRVTVLMIFKTTNRPIS